MSTVHPQHLQISSPTFHSKWKQNYDLLMNKRQPMNNREEKEMGKSIALSDHANLASHMRFRWKPICFKSIDIGASKSEKQMHMDWSLQSLLQKYWGKVIELFVSF